MQILYIGFDVEGVGGIATYTRHQIRALRELGHAVQVVSVNKQDKRFTDGYADLHIPFASRASVVGQLTRATLFPNQRLDAVVLNHVYLGMFGRIARAVHGSPYSLNVYNIDILEKLPSLREWAFAAADLVISDCRFTIEQMPRFHARVPKTGLLYDPVDTEFFRAIPKAEARANIARRFNLNLDGRFVAVTVAHMAAPPNNNKGHRQTIEALKHLADPRFLYLVVGAGPDRPAIETYVQAHGVSEQVKFLGLVDQDALPFLYAGSDVAILVSRGGQGLGEGVPLGMIEASACGTAVIGGNEDGSIEAIDPARPNGFAINPASSTDLAARLRQLADDPALCASMGRNGTAMVNDVFRFDHFTRQQGDLLRQMTGRT
jgi:glycosyltransferase involved in cell wall biosynthesis